MLENNSNNLNRSVHELNSNMSILKDTFGAGGGLGLSTADQENENIEFYQIASQMASRAEVDQNDDMGTQNIFKQNLDIEESEMNEQNGGNGMNDMGNVNFEYYIDPVFNETDGMDTNEFQMAGISPYEQDQIYYESELLEAERFNDDNRRTSMGANDQQIFDDLGMDPGYMTDLYEVNYN